MSPAGNAVQIEIISRTQNYTITSRIYDENASIFVSFMFAVNKPQQFGLNVFSKYRMNVVHVVCTGPHWYQYPDTHDAVRSIAEYVKRFPKTITYGISMGAYAALIFSRHIGAHAVLSFSPQYSLDPEKVPFEKRWSEHLSGIVNLNGFIFDDMENGLILDGQVVVAYDPLDDDSKHIELLRKIRPLSELVIPFSKHRSLRTLSETGLASQLLRTIAVDELDAQSIRNQFRAKRYESATYLSYLARHFERTNRNAAKLIVSRLAKVTRADDFEMFEGNFKILSRLGCEADAAEFLAKIFASKGYLHSRNSFSDIVKHAHLLQEFKLVKLAMALLQTHITNDASDQLRLYQALLLWLDEDKVAALMILTDLLAHEKNLQEGRLLHNFFRNSILSSEARASAAIAM